MTWIKISKLYHVYTGQRKNWTPTSKVVTPELNDVDKYGAGFYFTPNIEIAKQYAGETGSVYEADLNIENPLTPRMKDWLQFVQKGNATMKLDFLKRKGYDGIVDIQDKYKQIVVLDPAQITNLRVYELD